MERVIDTIMADPYLLAGTILVASVIAAFLINFITCRILMALTRKTKNRLDDAIIQAIRKPLFVTVVLIGLAFALDELEPGETLQYVVSGLSTTLAVLIWAVSINKVCRAILEALARRINDYKFIQERTLPLFEIVVKVVVYGGVAYGMLLAWHVDVTAWLASAGILGIAIGFAAKDTLANLFSGVFILADTPYKIGDFIMLDTGERGQVTDIGMRTTRLLTRDDIQIVFPNAAIANAKIVNETGGPHEKERVRVNVGVAYGSDIDKVREILMAVGAGSKYLAKEPEPRVRFREFGDSSLKFQLMGWIEEPKLRGRALDELHCKVYHRFNQEKIQIPFPQQDVYVKQLPQA